MPQHPGSPVDVGRFGSGQAVRRVEDLALLTGRGQFTDDLSRPAQAHLVFLRSPHAHARLRAIDVSAARALPLPVENNGFEPLTPCLQSRCSSQLS